MKKKIFSFIVICLILATFLFLIRTDFIKNPKIVKDADSIFFPSSPFTSMLNYIIDKFVNNMSITVIATSILFGMLSLFLLLIFIDRVVKDKTKKIFLIILFFSLSSLKAFSYFYNPEIVPEGSQVHYISHPAPFIFTSLLFIYLSYKYLKNEMSVYWVYFSFILSLFIYAQTIMFLPALFFLFLLDSKIDEFNFTNIKNALLSKKFIKFILFCLSIIIIFIILSDILIYKEFSSHIWQRKTALVGDYLGGSDALIFINLIKSKDYVCCDTFFSIEYITYILKTLFLISFYIVPITFLLIRKNLKRNVFINFMALMIIYYLIWMFFFNPETIAQDVWWMYAPSVFLSYALFAYISNFYKKRTVIAISSILIILNIISFIFILKLVQ